MLGKLSGAFGRPPRTMGMRLTVLGCWTAGSESFPSFLRSGQIGSESLFSNEALMFSDNNCSISLNFDNTTLEYFDAVTFGTFPDFDLPTIQPQIGWTTLDDGNSTALRNPRFIYKQS